MNRDQGARAKDPVISAEVVKMRRKALGLTQMQLSIMSATNLRTIQGIERGKQLDPATSVTLRIAKALSVTVEALCRGHGSWNRSHQAAMVPHDPEAGR
jgi:transcriptional regulator with XRE-family HTH domain